MIIYNQPICVALLLELVDHPIYLPTDPVQLRVGDNQVSSSTWASNSQLHWCDQGSFIDSRKEKVPVGCPGSNSTVQMLCPQPLLYRFSVCEKVYHPTIYFSTQTQCRKLLRYDHRMQGISTAQDKSNDIRMKRSFLSCPWSMHSTRVTTAVSVEWLLLKPCWNGSSIMFYSTYLP